MKYKLPRTIAVRGSFFMAGLIEAAVVVATQEAARHMQSGARITLLLKRKGSTRIRLLQGGIDAWRKNNYPIEAWPATVTSTGNAAGDANPR
jgi:3-mercaptopyruvate sulfurtransferase SseA